MQRLWIFSDLHQEWPDQPWDPAAHAPATGFDIAVVAGDVHTPLTAALDWLATRLAGMPVLYVPGNHDFYWLGGNERYTIYDQLQRGRDLASRLGIHLLLNDSVTMGSSRFIGGTLWTDFRLGSHSWVHAASTASARDGMQDYRRIRTGPTSKKRLRPSDVRQMHRNTRDFIAQTLAQPHSAGPTVVVTHHAPHPLSLANPNDDLRWCYASDLTDLIVQGQPDLWVHGHIHRRADYRIGATRVVANPRGHIEEKTGFSNSFTIEIGGSACTG
jgi:3',5'-cyclic AMP phosphodiesterase CpdA